MLPKMPYDEHFQKKKKEKKMSYDEKMLKYFRNDVLFHPEMDKQVVLQEKISNHYQIR